MKTFNILGKSNATISCILENLWSLYDTDFSVKIIKNLENFSDLPYRIENVEIEEFTHTDFLYNSQYLMGATRVPAKIQIYDFFSQKYGVKTDDYLTVVPKNVSISQTVKIGNGVMLQYGSTLAPYCQIGNLVSISRNVSIGHHTIIGNFSTINPGVNIAGNCKIGKNVSIGMGSNIIENLVIGDGAVIGAGTLVLKDVPENKVVYNRRELIVK